MRKILLFLGVLILTLGLTVGICDATLHVVRDENSIDYVDEAGVSIFTIDHDAGVTFTGTVTSTDDILMPTNKKIQFYSVTSYIHATSDNVMVIYTGGTLATTAVTSYTLTAPISIVAASTSHTVTSPAVKFVATTSVVHEYNGTNYVTQTVSSSGTVKVTTTGASTGSYEIQTDDATITLDAKTTLQVDIDGSNKYSFSVTGLDMNSLLITEMGKITATDAAGPAFINEAASAINPTLVPNRIDETTGIGWASSTLHFVVAGASAANLTASALTLPSGSGLVVSGGIAIGISMTGAYSAHGIAIGVSGGALDLDAFDDRLLSIWASSDATGGNVMPLYVEMVSTAACKARAAEFVLAPTAKLGQWGTALKAYLNLDGASGSAGTAAAICAELLVPDTTMEGHLFVLELEMVAPAENHVWGSTEPDGRLAFILMQLSGTDIDAIDDYGTLMTINGLTDGTGNMWFDNTLRIAVDESFWYIPLSTAQASYTTAYPVDITVAGGTALDIGASTTGINFTGEATNCIVATVVGTGTDGWLLKAGTDATSLSFVGASASAVGIFVDCTATTGFFKTVCVESLLTDTGGTLETSLYTIRGKAGLGGGSTTVDGASYIVGVQGRFDINGGTINHDDSRVAAVFAQLNLSDGIYTAGQVSGLWVDVTLGGTINTAQLNLLRVTCGEVGADTNSILWLYGEAAYLFDVSSPGDATWHDSGIYTLKVQVTESDRYIPLSTAVSTFTIAYPIVSSLASGAAIDITGPATGIDIGTNTTVGINMTGGGVLGIDFNGAWTGNVIQIGDSSAPLTTATSGLAGISIYYVMTKPDGGGFRGLYSNVEFDPDTQGYTVISAVHGCAVLGDTYTGDAGGITGIVAQLSVIDGGDLDDAGSMISALDAILTDTGSTSYTAGTISNVYIDNQLNDDFEACDFYMLNIANNANNGKIVDAAVRIYGPWVTNFVKFDTCQDGQQMVTAQVISAEDTSGKIKIDVNGSPFYLYYYN